MWQVENEKCGNSEKHFDMKGKLTNTRSKHSHENFKLKERNNGVKQKRKGMSYSGETDRCMLGERERKKSYMLSDGERQWEAALKGSRLLYVRSPPMERKKCSSAAHIHLTQGWPHGEYTQTRTHTHTHTNTNTDSYAHKASYVGLQTYIQHIQAVNTHTHTYTHQK